MTSDSSAPTDKCPQVLVLAGTTASGKTEVSIPLARTLDGEIVSADSRQIFRELEIGTAKPDSIQLAEVPHHFINEKSLHERWTAGDFSRAARLRLEEILKRGRTPIVVGGSMLYLRALLDGFYEAEDETVIDYNALREELALRGQDELYEDLRQCDPVMAARTSPADHHRVLRGLGVFRVSGHPLSGMQQAERSPLGRGFRLYFLHGDRAETYERVNLRVERMLALGLEKEVCGLMQAGFDESTCNALRTHGYQEVYPYLRGHVTESEMAENIKKAVRHYVKRQLTWFRSDNRVRWISRSFDEPATEIAARIAKDWLLN